jgi:hypothetical protein
MKAILLLAFAVVLVGAGLKLAGIPVPFIDYPVGSFGFDGVDPRMPRIEIEAPGYRNVPGAP